MARTVSLLLAECLDRVDANRAVRRDQAGEEGHSSQHDRDSAERASVRWRSVVCDRELAYLTAKARTAMQHKKTATLKAAAILICCGVRPKAPTAGALAAASAIAAG